jgi:hypothetical protein
VAWGKHYREGLEIEAGKVTSLVEADSVEILLEEGKKKKSQQGEVSVRKSSTLGQIRELIAMARKGRPITAIHYKGAEIDDDQPYEDWMTGTSGAPFQAV